jgi:WD40 repeat protein
MSIVRTRSAWLRFALLSTALLLGSLIVPAQGQPAQEDLKKLLQELRDRAELERQRALQAEQEARKQADLARLKALQAEQQARLGLERLRRVEYAHRIGLAEREWLDLNLPGVEQLLADCPEELRGWEWRHLKRLAALSQQQLPARHTGGPMKREVDNQYQVTQISADGRFLGALARPRGFKEPPAVFTVWDLHTGKNVFTSQEFPERGVVDNDGPLALSPDGKLLAGTVDEEQGKSRSVRVWEVSTRKEVGKVTESIPFLKLRLSPDGRRLAAATAERSVGVWDVVRGKRLFLTPFAADQRVETLDFSSDGKRLACGTQAGGVVLLDAENGKAGLTKHLPASVASIAWRPDGAHVAAAAQDDTVVVWNVSDSAEVWRLPRAGRMLAYSPGSGSLVIAGSADEGMRLTVRDAATGREVCSVRTQLPALSALGFTIREETKGRVELVAVATDGRVQFWDALRGQGLTTVQGAGDAVGSVAFSADGQRLAGVSSQGVRLWDTKTVTLAQELKAAGGDLVAFSADGSVLAVARENDNTIRVLDREGNVRTTLPGGHNREVRAVAASRDGKWIASGGYDGTVRLWDAATGKQARTIRVENWFVGSIAFSPDSKTLATGGFSTQLWDVETGKLQRELFRAGTLSVAFSADGKYLAAAENREVRIWDLAAGKQLHLLKGHTEQTNSVCFSPDGSLLASCSGSKQNGDPGEVRIWNVTKGELVHTLGAKVSSFESVAFRPDGKQLASAGDDGNIRLWDPTTGKEARVIEANRKGLAWMLSVVYSPDGKLLAGAGNGGEIGLWNPETGAKVRAIPASRIVEALAFTPDGKRLISGDRNRTVGVWDVATGASALTLAGHLRGIVGLAFHPDGKRLATVGSDETARIWDLATGDERLVIRGAAFCASFSPDGRALATAANDKSVRLWDAATGQEMARFRGHTNNATCVAFHPDGRQLASGALDNTIRVWDAATGQATGVLSGHQASLTGICWGPDGRRLFSGSADATVRIWDPVAALELLALRPHAGAIGRIAISPDGKRLAATAGSAIKLWEP